MSRLVSLLASGSAVVVPPPDPDPVDTTPYAMPTSAPWNAPVYAITPTPDGTGSLVHPDVIDFDSLTDTGLWNGWRYWMAVTPYYLANATKENPNVLVSADGFTWQYPGVAGNTFTAVNGGSNSDTDLVYDPANDRLVLTWREYLAAAPLTEWTFGATSTDGLTWSARTLLWTVGLDSGETDDRADNNVSQALVRVADNDWRAFVRKDNFLGGGGGGGTVQVRTATSPLGPWSAPANGTLVDGGGSLWHLDVIRHDGKFWGLFNYVWSLRPAVSTDGITWTVGPAALINRAGEWDRDTIYRSTIQPDSEDGAWVRCWYASDGPSSWRVGYTRLPSSLWTGLY